LEVLAWTNDTTRATALTYQDGVLVKNGDATRRYIGSFRTDGSNHAEDSVANRYLWNYYNRVSRRMSKAFNATSWTYTTATWRQANGSTANQLNFLVGVAEDVVDASCSINTSNGTGNVSFFIATGLNTTTAPSGAVCENSSANINQEYPLHVFDSHIPAVGVNYIAALERSEALGTSTWHAQLLSTYTNGLQGKVMA
jgi:hypothetical protein